MSIEGLARVAHAGGNLMDRDEQSIANTVVIAHLTHTSQQLNLCMRSKVTWNMGQSRYIAALGFVPVGEAPIPR